MKDIFEKVTFSLICEFPKTKMNVDCYLKH